MKCTFVAMGAENISLQALSALLKAHGHQTELAYDQALFDDKNYLYLPRIAALFDHRHVVLTQILESKPDMVGFSVLTANYQWALDMARRIKQRMDVPIVFGGIHPSTMPELVMKNDCVDMVVVGEGDYPMLDLCNAIEAGDGRTDIPNIWFKRDGKVISNEQRPVPTDLDELPIPDKALFAPHVPLKNYYLAVTARGCPFTCSYCECSYQARELKRLGAKRLRERSPQSVLRELEIMKERYGFKWVDFRNNTFTATPKWVREFLPEYKRRIGLPFRIFGHPLTIDREIAVLLKDTGCFSVQLGIESWSPAVRKEIFNRKETNEDILKAVEAMDEVGLSYSCDYILGAPMQNEEELKEAARFFMDRKSCYRVSAFMLAYQPKLDINTIGIKLGDVTQEEIEDMENGRHNHYLATGSVGRDPERLKFFNAYRLFFRLIPILPKRVNEYLLENERFKFFGRLPVDLLMRGLDLCMLFRASDKDARTYAKNYWYWITSRFSSTHPAYRGRGKKK
jgi:radical SAM superfamily enzyme YgiQ (UPF0313 family)